MNSLSTFKLHNVSIPLIEIPLIQYFNIRPPVSNETQKCIQVLHSKTLSRIPNSCLTPGTWTPLLQFHLISYNTYLSNYTQTDQNNITKLSPLTNSKTLTSLTTPVDNSLPLTNMDVFHPIILSNHSSTLSIPSPNLTLRYLNSQHFLNDVQALLHLISTVRPLMQNQSFLINLLPISQYILLSPLFQSQEALILVLFQFYSFS